MASLVGKAPKRVVSQEAFDEIVKENMVEFEMDLEEALEDAVTQLAEQGVDVSACSIVTTVKGRECVAKVRETMEKFNELVKEEDSGDLSGGGMIASLEAIKAGCSASSDFRMLACKEGAMGGVAYCCKKFVENAEIVEMALRCIGALASNAGSGDEDPSSTSAAALLKREALPKKGLEALCSCLKTHMGNASVVAAGASAVQKLCLRFEPNKAAFREAGMNKIIQKALRTHNNDKQVISAVCGLICTYTADDDRREGVHPGTFMRARELGEDRRRGAVVPIFSGLKENADDARFVGDVCFALKHLAVNDTICKNITKVGGLEATLDVFSKHMEDAVVASRVCSFLKAVARNDENKRILCLRRTQASDPEESSVARGLGLILHSMETHLLVPSVVEQAIAAFSVVTLRQPEICERIAEAGMVNLIVAAMSKYPEKPSVQRAAMITLRNMVSSWQNEELKSVILDEGVEPLIRSARAKHPECEDVAFAALRDLGLNYHD